MNRCKSLLKLRRTFVARLERLERRLSASATLAPQDRDPVISYVTIESLNAWSQFAKALYLSCMLNAKTESKATVVVVPAGASLNDAIGLAITKYKRSATPNSVGEWARRDEPPWHDPNILLGVCQQVNCSIYLQMQSAFSLGQRVFLDLPVFRNFFAHRNRLSSRAAMNLGPLYLLPSSLRPSDILMRSKPMAVASVLEEWIAELKITAEFLCQ
jgi:hypothetical protein